ncbi:hypothetical protein VTI28DRAFT_6677 [Corynascus sepedonium]
MWLRDSTTSRVPEKLRQQGAGRTGAREHGSKVEVRHWCSCKIVLGMWRKPEACVEPAPVSGCWRGSGRGLAWPGVPAFGKARQRPTRPGQRRNRQQQQQQQQQCWSQICTPQPAARFRLVTTALPYRASTCLLGT